MKYKYIQRTTVAGQVFFPGDPVGVELSENEIAKFWETGHIGAVKETKPKVEAKPKKKKAAKREKEVTKAAGKGDAKEEKKYHTLAEMKDELDLDGEEVANGNGQNA